jgi:hypothetical protein
LRKVATRPGRVARREVEESKARVASGAVARGAAGAWSPGDHPGRWGNALPRRRHSSGRHLAAARSLPRS